MEPITPPPYRIQHLGCALPVPVPDAGILYLGAAADGPRTALRWHLREEGARFTEPFPGVLAVPLRPGLLERMADRLPADLTEPDARGARALLARDGATVTVADLLNTQSLAALLAGVRHRWLVEMLREDRLVTHFHPIVRADDPADVFGHECLVRGVSPTGTLVSPGTLFAAAREADLVAPLDRQARLTAIRSAARLGVGPHLFLNFNPSTITAPEYGLRTAVRAVAEAGIAPSGVVFEVVESEEVRDVGRLLQLLNNYRAAGFRVALDDVGAGYNSLTLLTRLRPDFVKLDMELTRGVDRDRYKARVVSKLLEMARDIGARTVVEGVETDGEWEWARAYGADFVQGYLFARPATPPPVPAVPVTV
ncbi:MAG TPA: EAL domain-containing protein [Fimbriiglobus sp.]|jgi:EAL domain-containing protein (putative c-di-GMP-specific phosphodiesterase class I)|nr:EAL domain-containing protein [Fimbriiglobus sp.]